MAVGTATVTVLVATVVPARGDVSVGGDSERESIVGRGGILLDGTYRGESGDRHAVADCPGCRWRLVHECEAIGEQNLCGEILNRCSASQTLWRVWHRPGSSGWVRRGTVCLGPGGPVSTVDVATLVQDGFRKRLPKLSPNFAPKPAGLTGLPVVFQAGQRDAISFEERMLGFGVTVEASGSWLFRYPGGAQDHASDPGGPWPEATFSHTFRKPGSFPVRVTATWDGSYTVDGIGRMRLERPVVQEASVQVAVREARAVLVSR